MHFVYFAHKKCAKEHQNNYQKHRHKKAYAYKVSYIRRAHIPFVHHDQLNHKSTHHVSMRARSDRHRPILRTPTSVSSLPYWCYTGECTRHIRVRTGHDVWRGGEQFAVCTRTNGQLSLSRCAFVCERDCWRYLALWHFVKMICNIQQYSTCR